MDIIKKIAEELQIKATQAEAAVKLIDEGCTIPFIARYRKEATGALNDEQLRNLDERLRYLRNLEDRKEQVIASIEEQGKLTDELKQQILAAETMVLVEDLYRPYKQKRKRLRTTGRIYFTAKYRQAVRGGSRQVHQYGRRKRSSRCQSGNCGCNGYYCRADFRCGRLQNIYP